MVNHMELNILKLLAFRSDVNWNWYNLDRAMAMRNMEGIGNVAQLLRGLSEARLVTLSLEPRQIWITTKYQSVGMNYWKSLSSRTYPCRYARVAVDCAVSEFITIFARALTRQCRLSIFPFYNLLSKIEFINI